MSNERLSEFLNVFSNSIQEEILDFCRRISSTKADIYIFLARKAAVFCDCLEELGQIHLDGYITTDRSLDIDSKWLKGKNVVIIDDAVVSGTTLFSIIRKLKNADVKNITVQILTINKRWFNSELLENDLGESYIYPTYNKLSDNLCIKLCNEIVQAVSIIPRPYDIDFPLYKRVSISEFEFDRIISLNNWYSYDNRTCMQKEHNIINTTLIPCDNERKKINSIFGIDFTHNTIVKIRLYGRIIDKEKRIISLQIVPMIVFNDMNCLFADQVFELMISIVGEKDLFKEWNSCSKLRLIQFYYSNQLAKYWYSCISHVFDCDHELIFSRRNLSFLFPSHLISSVEKICNILIKIPIEKGLTYRNSEHYEEIISDFNAVDPVSVNARLYEPFLDMYHNKEIPCRSLVLLHGKKVFQKKEYEELINRLNVGLSYSDMLNRLKYCSSEYDIERIVSAFIDRSIDAGIIVPIFQQEGQTVFRAYRHGEDVLFGCREELMYRKMLTLFYEYSGSDNGITRIETEKLIVLFTKIGLKEKILYPYTSNFISEPMDKNGNIMKILSIKPYLKGPVSLLGSARNLQKNKYIPYITNERKSLWMTNVLVQNGTLIKRPGVYKYEIAKPDKNVEADFELLTDEEKSFVQNFSELAGRISNPSCNTGVVYDDTDWARISVTLTLSDTVNAVAAEMELFYNDFDLTNVLYFSGDKRNDYEEIKHYVGSYAFESVHSAGMKIESYIENKGRDLINSVRFPSNIEQRTWIGYFSEELGNHSDENNKFLKIVFYEQNVWAYLMQVVVNAIYLTLYYRYYWKYSIKNKELKRINTAIGRINKSLKALEKLREDDMNKHDAKKLFAILDKIKPYIILLENDREKDFNSIFNELREAIAMTENIASNIKENVCDILGEQGKVNDIVVYNYAVHINIDRCPDDREDEVLSILEKAYRHEINEIKALKQKLTSRGNAIPHMYIKELPHEYKPIPNSGLSTSGIWYIAAGGGIEKNITVFAMNVYYMLFVKNIDCRVTIFDRLSYEYSIRSNTSDRMEFHCNQFNLLMNDFKESILFPETKKYSSSLIHVCSEYIKNKSNVEDKIKNTKCFKVNKSYTLCGSTDSKDIYSITEYSCTGERKVMNNKEQFDFGIITILPEELAAIIEIFKLKKTNYKYGDRVYYKGTLSSERNERIRSIICTQALYQGELSVISAYNELIKRYHPRIVFLIGIAGGVVDRIDKQLDTTERYDLDLCDVVIAKSIVDYELRKESKGEIEHRGTSYNVDAAITSVVNDYLSSIYEKPMPSSEGSKNSTVHVVFEPIGSGNAVIANELSEIIKWLKNFNSKVVAVEMEAVGINSAFYESSHNSDETQGLVIVRGISDFADIDKSLCRAYRAPAAKNAALISRELMENFPSFESHIDNYEDC